MSWKDELKLKKMLETFDFKTRYKPEKVHWSRGKGIDEAEFHEVVIEWNMTFDVKADNLLMTKPEVERMRVIGIDATFDDSENYNNIDWENFDVDVNEIEVKFEGWSGDIGVGWNIMPAYVEFEISRSGDDIWVENVSIVFG
mgnify:CR=1 FL=1